MDELLSYSYDSGGPPITKPIPTKLGDALILWTTGSYTIYAVGLVSEDGQQGFDQGGVVTYAPDRPKALAQANAIVAPSGRVFLVNIDDGTWARA